MKELEKNIAIIEGYKSECWDAYAKAHSVFVNKPVERAFSFAYRSSWNTATEAAKPRWIPVTERLPNPGKKVLAAQKTSYGATIRICAMYVPAKWLNCDDEPFEEGAEYDEETDNYYWPAGWYERIENWDDYSSVAVYGEITHWLELPEIPE